MAYVISNDCVRCGSCSDVCPMGAIHMGDEHFEIDENVCVECGACADTCPVGAIAQG